MGVWIGEFCLKIVYHGVIVRSVFFLAANCVMEESLKRDLIC